jgi:NADH-quinone oxidoreductase subunit I
MAEQTCNKPRKKVSFTGYVVKPVMATVSQTVRDSIGGRPNTVLYPKERLVLPSRYRGKHVLSFTKCIGCSQCVDICPNQCMWMKKIEDPVLGKIERPGVDYARCLFCGLCVEICPTDALLETGEYELSSLDREGMRYQPESLRNDDYPVREPKQFIKLPALDLGKCKEKGDCVKICPVKCIKMVEIEKTGRRKPEIDMSLCTHCGKCAEVCPEKAFEMQKKLIVMFERPLPKFSLENCSGCAACMRNCPSDVIYMLEMPGTEKKKADGTMTKPKKRAVFTLEKCIGCGRCEKACKFDSLEMMPEAQWKIAAAPKPKKKGGKKE